MPLRTPPAPRRPSTAIVVLVAQVHERRRRDGRGARLEAADLGDLALHLDAGQVPSGAGLGPLAQLEVERLAAGSLVHRPAELAAGQLVEVAGALGPLLGQHPALARADPGSGPLSTAGQSHLGLLRQRPEAHIAHQQRDLQTQRPGRAGADDHLGADGLVVEAGAPGELGGHELDVVPAGQLGAGHAHRGDRSVMAQILEALVGQAADKADMGLGRLAVGVLVAALVGGPVEGLGVLLLPGQDLVEVHQQVVAVEPGRELGQSLGVVVARHPGVEHVVPAVEAADEVVVDDAAVAHQRAPVQAAPVEHRVVPVEAHDDQVDVADQRPDRLPVGHVAPSGDLVGLHEPPP